MKIIIVGGVAGGATAAARTRRLNEQAEIIIFEHEGSTMVKRIAAVGGETIEANGKIYTVPKGRLFVLGDNKQNSFDSRYWEEPFVDEANVIAKVIGK